MELKFTLKIHFFPNLVFHDSEKSSPKSFFLAPRSSALPVAIGIHCLWKFCGSFSKNSDLFIHIFSSSTSSCSWHEKPKVWIIKICLWVFKDHTLKKVCSKCNSSCPSDLSSKVTLLGKPPFHPVLFPKWGSFESRCCFHSNSIMPLPREVLIILHSIM